MGELDEETKLNIVRMKARGVEPEVLAKTFNLTIPEIKKIIKERYEEVILDIDVFRKETLDNYSESQRDLTSFIMGELAKNKEVICPTCKTPISCPSCKKPIVFREGVDNKSVLEAMRMRSELQEKKIALIGGLGSGGLIQPTLIDIEKMTEELKKTVLPFKSKTNSGKILEVLDGMDLLQNINGVTTQHKQVIMNLVGCNEHAVNYAVHRIKYHGLEFYKEEAKKRGLLEDFIK